MTIKEIEVKTVLRKNKKIESWFLTRYGMNLYRGCLHNCTYCDGRSEKYRVDGNFGEDVEVKINAIDVLKRELDLKRKKNPFKKGYVGISGGVGDCYQPLENKYNLTKKTLNILCEKNFPVHILTKSTLVKRDIGIIKKINTKARAIVSFSFSSADDKISSIFEPNVPSPTERFETVKMLKDEGIYVGMYLMPVIPFITDTVEKISETISKAYKVGIDFVIFSGMTLKDGRQKEYFYDILKKQYPELLVDYHNIYRDSKWGNAIQQYYTSLNQIFLRVTKEYNIPVRMPLFLFKDLISENDLVIVILEHIDYLLKLSGSKSPFGYAAYNISKINTPLSDMKYELKKIRGVGVTTEKIILEILKTGNSSYYSKLIS